MNVVFWSIVVINATLFIAILISTLKPSGSDSGGRAMAQFFLVVVPSIVLVLAVLLYVFSQSVVLRGVALAIVAGPGLFIGGQQVRSVFIDYQVKQDMLGRGYFSGSAMKAMGAAVVQADAATLQKLGPGVDVNTVGDDDMTLMRLATETTFQQQATTPTTSQLAVVQTLLQLGAKPDSGLERASLLSDPLILSILLKAGGNPNLRLADDVPLVFSALSVLPLESLRLLTEHGLDVNTVSYGNSLAFEAAIHHRWDLLTLLVEHGADARKPREDGRTPAGEIARVVDEQVKAGVAPEPALLRLAAQIAK